MILISILKWIENFFYNFICFITNMISVLSLFECIIRSSSLSIEEIKLFAIVNWIFHVSNFLRLFIMLLKYGLIYLDFFLLMVFYFHHRYFCIQYNFYSRNYLMYLPNIHVRHIKMLVMNRRLQLWKKNQICLKPLVA